MAEIRVLDRKEGEVVACFRGKHGIRLVADFLRTNGMSGETVEMLLYTLLRERRPVRFSDVILEAA